MKSSFVRFDRPYFAPGSSGAPASASGAEQIREVHAVLRQHPDGHQHCPGDEQDRLDDLHVGGALHAADQHVGDHQRADSRDHEALAGAVVDVHQQRHQPTGARHLREQIEERHDQRGRRRRGAHRTLTHPERQDVRHREAAGVAQQLGDQQQRDQPGDEEADAVEEAVVTGERDRAGDTEKRSGGQVVAGDRDTVLPAGEAALPPVYMSEALLFVLAGPQNEDHGHGDERRRKWRG